MKVIALSLFLIIFLPILAEAAPLLYNPVPENNSFVPSGPRTFYINITESSLNTSSAALYIKAQDEISYAKFPMECENLTLSDWICNTTVELRIVGSDTVELFYINASDNLGNYSSNGTAQNPLKVTVDKNPPSITYINPTNNSWVKGIVRIELSVADASSGVNISDVNYSFDNSTWKNMTKTTNFYAEWNTSVLANNQTVTIYTKASDNVGNTHHSWINVTVDNEFPRIEVLNPTQNQTLKSIPTFTIKVNDSYSGINANSASFSVDGIKESMDCTGSTNYTCTKLFDTFRLSDGVHFINFSASDNAGNLNATSVRVEVANIQSLVTITAPANNSYARNVTTLRASLSDPRDVNEVKFLLNRSGVISENTSMFCTWDYSSCTASLNTSQYQDGTYAVIVRAISSQKGVLANSSITLIFDNTKPGLIVAYPQSPVKGNFTVDANITDEHPNENKAVLQVKEFSKIMSCARESGSKLVCEVAFDSKLLDDGTSLVKISAEDMAGNSVSSSKEIEIANYAAISNQTTSNQTTGPEKNETIPQNETKSNTNGNGIVSNIVQSLSNPKTVIILGLIVAVIVIALIMASKRRKVKQERPWYDAISEKYG